MISFSRVLKPAVLSLLTLVSGAAFAEISHSESFEPSKKTSLKIAEPPDAHVFVTVGAEVKEDTTPAIFALPNADAYVLVKLVTHDGESWSSKVEIKAGHQTVLHLTQTKKAAAAAPAATPRFTGRLTNTSDKCDWPENVKFVVTRDGAQVVASQMVFPGKDFPVVLEKGHYAVQILDTSNSPLAGKQFDVGTEGWTFVTGCVK
jgi:hypothetical protein